MPDPVLNPALTPPTMAPTVGHVEAITDNQTWLLTFRAWIRMGVGVASILIGMAGYDVAFKPRTPTPPDQGIAALVELLKAQQKPAPIAAPKLTLAEVMARLEEIKAEQAKGK